MRSLTLATWLSASAWVPDTYKTYPLPKSAPSTIAAHSTFDDLPPPRDQIARKTLSSSPRGSPLNLFNVIAQYQSQNSQWNDAKEPVKVCGAYVRSQSGQAGKVFAPASVDRLGVARSRSSSLRLAEAGRLFQSVDSIEFSLNEFVKVSLRSFRRRRVESEDLRLPFHQL